jgi:hypothetical protein
MSAPKTYPPEVRDRAVRPVDDLLADDQLQLSVSAADNLTAVPLPGRVSCNLLTLRAGYNVCSVAILDRRVSARAARSAPRLGRRACSVEQAARQPRRT